MTVSPNAPTSSVDKFLALVDKFMALGTNPFGILGCLFFAGLFLFLFILILNKTHDKDAGMIALACFTFIAMLFCLIPIKRTVDEFGLFKTEEQKQNEREQKELRKLQKKMEKEQRTTQLL